MLIIFNFDQSKNNSIYLYDIINLIWYKAKDWEVYLKIECKSKEQALAIEKHIKKMKSKVYIQNLKKYSEMKFKLLEKYSESSPR